MGTHKECGEDITWVRRDDQPDRWAPPLQFAGYAKILTDGPNGDKVAVEVATYKTHHCDPEKIIAWQEYKARLAAIEASSPPVVKSMTDWEIARQRNQEEAMAFATAVACPQCHMGVDEPCVSMAKGKTLGQPVKNPHTKRTIEAEENNS